MERRGADLSVGHLRVLRFCRQELVEALQVSGVRQSGSVQPTGTAEPIEHYIADYEAELEERSKRWTLFVHDDPAGSPAILMALRAALGLSLEEAARLKQWLPGVLDQGARARLEPLCEALKARRISAERRLSPEAEESRVSPEAQA